MRAACPPPPAARRRAARRRRTSLRPRARRPRQERELLRKCTSSLGECLGACERIVQTPIPLHYSRHTSRFVTMYVSTLPFLLVGALGALTLPVMGALSWALFGILEIGHLIEEPFSSETDDDGQMLLPLNDLCRTIRRDVVEVARHADIAEDHGLEVSLPPMVVVRSSAGDAPPREESGGGAARKDAAPPPPPAAPAAAEAAPTAAPTAAAPARPPRRRRARSERDEHNLGAGAAWLYGARRRCLSTRVHTLRESAHVLTHVTSLSEPSLTHIRESGCRS